MKAILLDGSKPDESTGKRIREALTVQLQAHDWEVEHFSLCESRIGNCAGDFFCFIRTPGVCNVNDDNRLIAKALANCDLMVYLTPVVFGGFSSTLKIMVDHQIQNISPFFAKVAGETHHARRYKENPDLLSVGWLDAHNAQSEAVFRHLVQRIALNWHAKTWVSEVVLANQSDADLRTSVERWVDDVQNHTSSARVELPVKGEPATESERGNGNGRDEIRRALLLIGSPKTRKSTSYSLGGYLFEQLSGRAIEPETIYLHTVLRNPQKWQALLEAVEAADLVMLAFPLYCDSLPAAVIEALERIAAHRQGRNPAHRQLFSAIANCGFPEATQCDTALAICEIFGNQAGFTWAGSLALGGGGMVDGFSLAEGGGKTILMRHALDLAAEGLVEQGAIPQAARDGLAKPLIPHWLYWLVSFRRFVLDSNHYGAMKLMRRQPYLAKAR